MQHIRMCPVPIQMRCLVIFLAATFTSAVAADNLTFDVQGLRGALLDNARSSVRNLAVSDSPRIGQRRLERMRREAVERVTASLRPFGYYHPTVTTTLEDPEGAPRRLMLQVDRGPPVRVATLDIRLQGPGAPIPDLVEWRREWPLREGLVLNHGRWETAKQDALDRLDYRGYIKAAYSDHRIELDLDNHEADLKLVLETGPRAVLGEIQFDQDVVDPELLEKLPRFDSGQPYDGFLIEKLRYDLWQTGFYDTIDVVEERLTDQEPPVVNINARLVARNRDTWQGTLGFGSDTEIRTQLNWTRHWLSERGDTLAMGLGWQQRDDRYLFRTNYRLPRGDSRRSYWIAESLYREETQEFEVSAQDEPDRVFDLTSGDLEHYVFKGGILNLRDIRGGYQQISETWFVQYLRENVSYAIPEVPLLIDGEPVGAPGSPLNRRLFSDDNSSVAVGIEWDWPVIQGQGFETVGHHQEARLFSADSAWGSNREFNRAYLASRWNFLVGERFKVLLRAEVGYSDADVEEFDLAIADDVIRISLTELPNLYRFQAGGSQSVRGYAYESLSNNGIGSNNIITFSAEGEWQFRETWSLAAFYDVGNAFNDWSETDLKQGAGVGLRWYTIAGAVRLDVASALDLPGDPWRIHFTLGVPLL